MRETIEGLKAMMVMVIVQILYAGLNVFYKLAANDGINLRVVIAYRCIFATAFIALFALILEKTIRPKLTWTVLFQAFLCALFGISLTQNLHIEGIVLTSATFFVAIFYLVPAFPLTLTILFRLDKLELRTAIGRAKVVGIITGIGGAMILTFYKEIEINIWSTNLHLIKHAYKHQNNHGGGSRSPGSFFALFSCISHAMWFVF